MAGEDVFASVLRANERVTDHLSYNELAALADPTNYRGLSGRLVDRTVVSAGEQ